jgi:SAM-dependent methyltransferase
MNDYIKNLCAMITDLRGIKEYSNNSQEVVIDSNNKITTPEFLTKFSASSSSQEYILQNARKRLSDRLIQLNINEVSTTSATDIEKILSNKIVSFYAREGIQPEITKHAIDISCDSLYGMNEKLFTKTLEPRVDNQDKSTLTQKYSLNPSDLSTIESLLINQEFTPDSIDALLKLIKKLATDNNLDTINAIIHTLEIEYNITNYELLQNIIVILFGDDKFLEIIASRQQDEIKEKQRADTLKLNSIQIAELNQQKKIQKLQERYDKTLSLYRAKGLEPDKKHTLVIGSAFSDITGAVFDKHTTIFANLNYADLNGDIFDTIDILHQNNDMHGKLSLVNFTGIGGINFNDIDKSICLFIKLHELLQPDGILIISDGTVGMNSEINLNSKFAKKILLPAGFELDNIVSITTKTSFVHNYTRANKIFDTHKGKIEDHNKGLSLVAKK